MHAQHREPFERTALVLTLFMLALGNPALCQDGPGFPTLPADQAAGSGLLQPCFEPLPGKIECGRFRVFEDRAAAKGRTLDLAFVVARAFDPKGKHAKSKQRDAVTFFLGGPGSSPTDQAAGFIGLFRGVRQSRDLLFLDFRGAGASGALSCDVPYPRGAASRFDELFPPDHLKACANALSERARLDLYTSAASMDDLEDLRTWLGYSALNFWTGSYGTREAQVFLRRHPKAVRTVVLNAPSPIFEKPYLSHARGLQDALDRLLAECAGNAECREAYPELDKELKAVLSRVRLNPPKVKAEGREVTLSAGALGYALRGLLYRRGGEVPYFVHRAAMGEWQPLADYFLERQSWVARPNDSTGYHFSVICAESIDFVTDEEVRRHTKGTFLGDFLIGAYREACRTWPHIRLRSSFLEPVKSDVPTLILSGERDPVTPPSNGKALEAVFTNSRHVVVPNGGHGVFGPCFQGMVQNLVESGRVDGLDDSCVKGAEPTSFRLPD